jgi:hypothetical protein
MKDIYKKALLVIVGTTVVTTIALFSINNPTPAPAVTSGPTPAAHYRPTQTAPQTAEEVERDYQLFSAALDVIHEHYGTNAPIEITYVNASTSYIEIDVSGLSMGGDASYQWLTQMFSRLCKLNSGQTIINVAGSFVSLMDLNLIEVFIGNRKPHFWDDYSEKKWKRNREAYGAGLTTREDDEYEINRVMDIVRERGLTPGI